MENTNTKTALENTNLFKVNKKIPLYAGIAGAIGALSRCVESKNDEWTEKWGNLLRKIEKDILPSGSGIDSGTFIIDDQCTEEKIVLSTSFHHMNDGGMYDGWTEHKIVVTPSLQFGFSLKVTGRNRNDIKSYLHEVFSDILSKEY